MAREAEEPGPGSSGQQVCAGSCRVPGSPARSTTRSRGGVPAGFVERLRTPHGARPACNGSGSVSGNEGGNVSHFLQSKKQSLQPEGESGCREEVGTCVVGELTAMQEAGGAPSPGKAPSCRRHLHSPVKTWGAWRRVKQAAAPPAEPAGRLSPARLAQECRSWSQRARLHPPSSQGNSASTHDPGEVKRAGSNLAG